MPLGLRDQDNGIQQWEELGENRLSPDDLSLLGLPFNIPQEADAQDLTYTPLVLSWTEQMKHIHGFWFRTLYITSVLSLLTPGESVS